MSLKDLLGKAARSWHLIVAALGLASGAVGVVLLITGRLADGSILALLGVLLVSTAMLLARLRALSTTVRRAMLPQSTGQMRPAASPRPTTPSATSPDLVAGLATLRLDLAERDTHLGVELAALRETLDTITHSAQANADQQIERQTRQNAAALDLHTLLEPKALTPLPGGFAAELSTIHELVGEVLAWPVAPTVVECGSGSSTLWLALACRRRGGGKVIALEHDENYGRATRSLLDAHGVSEYAEVRVAPLERHQSVSSPSRWYAAEALDDIEAIDILFVDGPPGHVGRLARYPAPHALRSRLSTGSLIVLDDAPRADETETLDRWKAELPLEDLGLRGRTHYLRLTEPSSPETI
jgi:predicted O-methyltransferase YrrM